MNELKTRTIKTILRKLTEKCIYDVLSNIMHIILELSNSISEYIYRTFIFSQFNDFLSYLQASIKEINE